jgi:small subunit ribosomal protein S16
MVRLRLRRVGRKKQPSYRLVAAEKESPRDGRFLEVVGFYNPRTQPSTIKLKEDRIYHWLSQGAQPSNAVDSLFRQMGTWERFERFKAGEKIEKLLEEAAQAEASRAVSPQTRYDIPPAGKVKKVTKAKEAPQAAPAAKAKEEAPEAVAEKAPAKEKPVEKPAKEEKPTKEPEAEKAEAKATAEKKPVEKPEPKAEAKTETKAKAKTKTEPKTKAKAKAKAETKAKTKAKTKTAKKTDAKK